MNISVIHNQLEEYLKTQLRSERSVDSYIYEIKKFVELYPQYITYEYKDIAAFFVEVNERYRREDGKITGTVSRIFAAIKWLYSFLIHINIRETHPFPPSYSIKGTQIKGIYKKNLLTPHELQTLLIYVQQEKIRFEVLELRNQTIISLLVHQALTSSEIIQLELKDLNLDAGTIYIKRSLTANARRLFLSSSQVMLFFNYITLSRKKLLHEDKPFHTTQTKLIVGMRNALTQEAIHEILNRYKLLFGGKPVTATNIRKSVIYNLLNEEKKSVEEVQLFAGHRWPSSTELYLSDIDFNDNDFVNKVHPMELLN